MRNVKNHTKLVSNLDYLASEVGQTVIVLAVVAAGGRAKVVAKPSHTENAHACGVEITEYLRTSDDARSALDGEQGGVLARTKRALDVGVGVDLLDLVLFNFHTELEVTYVSHGAAEAFFRIVARPRAKCGYELQLLMLI
jgi:hypothetical protein